MFLRATILFVSLIPALGLAGDWDVSGYLATDLRLFSHDPVFSAQYDKPEWSLAAQPEIRWRSDDGNQRVNLVAFLRADAADDERSHIDIREAFWSLEGADWDLTIGLNKVFWGVTESRHLVDIINQTDLVEDIDTEDKLGQPMVNLNLQRDWGLIELYLLPGFRKRTFPGTDGRLRAPIPVSTNARYQSSATDLHTDIAVRYSHYFGDVDLGMHVFHGTNREPRFQFHNNQLVPVYDQMSQFGIEVQYTHEAWLWKFEGLARHTDTETFQSFVAGVEYTFFGVTERGADLGVLAEWLHDGRDSLVPFDDDVFAGARLAFNDVNDTSVLAGVIVDPATQEKSFSVEAETRFNDHLTGELRLRTFSSKNATGALSAIEKDDYLQLRLTWYY
jgi:hypothetical protein